MAALTNAEKLRMRRKAEIKANATDTPIRWTKDAHGAATQAIEDAMSDNAFQLQVSSDIDVATAPYGFTYTNAEKKWLFAYNAELTFRRDG